MGCCIVCAGGTYASEPDRTVTVAPGARYRAGWLYSSFLGAHWRDAWTAAIEVPVLDLETFAGESSSKWYTGYGGGFWLGVFASGVNPQFASALKATVVHSDEGTSFYLFSGFSL